MAIPIRAANGKTAQQSRGVAAPPVYRPTQAASAPTAQTKPTLIGPPVYRPQHPASTTQRQQKLGGAPPVYRPTQTVSTPMAVQQKTSGSGPSRQSSVTPRAVVGSPGPSFYQPPAATPCQAIQPSPSGSSLASAVIQRVGVTSVNVNQIFTDNHVASGPQDALNKYILHNRQKATTYVTKAPKTGDITQTRDKQGGRGLSDQEADFDAGICYKVQPLRQGGGHLVTKYQSATVVLKGNVQGNSGRRGYIFHVTGINRAAFGTKVNAWEKVTGQAPRLVYPAPQPVVVQPPQQVAQVPLVPQVNAPALVLPVAPQTSAPVVPAPVTTPTVGLAALNPQNDPIYVPNPDLPRRGYGPIGPVGVSLLKPRNDPVYVPNPGLPRPNYGPIGSGR